MERAITKPGAARTGLPREGGTYMLGIEFQKPRRIAVGRLGEFDFPAGFYLYVGSALGGLRGRIERHLRTEKQLRWHIDCLTLLNPVTRVWWAAGDGRMECAWARRVTQLTGASVPAPGFGSSDCRCDTHLVCMPGLPSAGDLMEISACLDSAEAGFQQR